MKKVLTLFASILIVINLAIGIASNYPVLGFKVFRIVSGSMIPTIEIGDLVIIKSGSYQINDIVTVKENNYYITHRLESINNDKIILKGDANNKEDDPRFASDVVGKVIFVLPSLIYLLIKYSCIVSIIVLIFMMFVGDKNEKREDN